MAIAVLCFSFIIGHFYKGVNVGDRWEDYYEIARPHLDDHLWMFNDMHYMLACLKSHEKDVSVNKIMESLKSFVRLVLYIAGQVHNIW